LNLEITDREVISTGVLNAPRELVFRAFSDPEHIARWWGPVGFRNTIHEFDFRRGGYWHCTMHGPDGADYKNDYVFLEIAEPERIVIGHPDPAHDFQLIVTLDEKNEKTQRRWRQRFASLEHFKQVKEPVIEATEQNLDRLEGELAKLVPSGLT
jgi:uncharacterized protein YndB with AHSA1/START domain